MLNSLLRKFRGSAQKIAALQAALAKRNASIDALKTKVDTLSERNKVLADTNVQLKAKVAELYEKNKDYAKRLRDLR